MTEEQKPLTRDDVRKMIKEHGGPEGLDLSGKDLDGIDLSGLYLESIDAHLAKLTGANLVTTILAGSNFVRANLIGANLIGADLFRANLQQADLFEANLQEARLFRANLQEADLRDANLEGAKLGSANLERANLQGANLQEAVLSGANLQGAKLRYANLQRARLSDASLQGAELGGCDMVGASMERINWGSKYIVGDEEQAEKEEDKDYRRSLLGYASHAYRNLKKWHTDQGLYNLAGEFYFREMTVRRKALKWWPNPLLRAWSKFLAVLCGYGERPLRVVAAAAVVVFGLAGICSFSALTFLDSLYHSAVSFTALGYGLGVSTPEGWVKGLGAFEAFIGVFMIALFLITIVRKMTR